MQAKYQTPSEFWDMHGAGSPLLRPVALVVLRLNHAAGGCERNWSTHDFLCSKRRASTSVETLAQECYFYGNQRMLDQRRLRGKAAKHQAKYYDNDGNEIDFPLWVDREAASGTESLSE
jgi:hypothetical protein